MKNALFSAALLALTILNSCGPKEQKAENKEEIQPLTAGNTLTDIQTEKIKKFHTTFAEVYDFSLEETMNNFRGEANVDSEIGVWMQMADAYENYIDSQPNDIHIKTKKEAYKLILLRSMMSDEETLQNAKLKVLSTEQAKEVLSYYSLKPDPLDDFETK